MRRLSAMASNQELTLVPSSGNRKKRTREHVIADLSTSYVERHVYRRGHSVRRVESDYGFDLLVFTYDPDGRFESGEIQLQLKATDALKEVAGGTSVAFPIDIRDLRH